MTTAEAAQILQLPGDATPAQIEARFRELRAMLEEKIAKALTPGLQAKYRSSFAEITTAFETLILAADTAALPGLTSAPAAMANPSRLPPLPAQVPAPLLPPLPTSSPRPSLPPLAMQVPGQAVPPAPVTPAKKSGGKGLLIGVAAGVIVLAAGGWLVMKVRADSAQKTRLEAEANQREEVARQQEKARVAAAEKAERDKQDKLFAALRSRATELNAAYDVAMRTPAATERELADLKAKSDDLSGQGKSITSPEMRTLSDQFKAREKFLAWLGEHLPGHPAKIARVKAVEALSPKTLEAAATALDAYEKTVKQLKAEVADARRELLTLMGSLRITSTPTGTDFTLTDNYGRTSSGQTPAELTDVPLGGVTVAFKRDGWPEIKKLATVTRAEAATVSADLTGGNVSLASAPVGLDFQLEGAGRTERGRTPATLTGLPPGDYSVTFARDGWPALTQTVSVRNGVTTNALGDFPAPGVLKVTSTPAGAAVTFKGQAVGMTPLVLPDLPPGPVAVDVTLADYHPEARQGSIEPGKETLLSATLRQVILTAEQAYAKFAKDANGTWVCHTKNGLGGATTLYLRFVAGSKTLSFQQTGFGGSTRNLTMVGYDAANRIVLIAFGGLDALNGKISIRIDGDTLLFGRGNLTNNPTVFRRATP